MSETVFVVLCECCEELDDYDRHPAWVSGVFKTREEAERLAVEKLARRREHDAWFEKYLRLKGTFDWSLPVSVAELEDRERIVREKAGVEPPFERAQYVEIFEVEVG